MCGSNPDHAINSFVVKTKRFLFRLRQASPGFITKAKRYRNNDILMQYASYRFNSFVNAKTRKAISNR